MKAYKVFNSDWTCSDFKYEVGKTYLYRGEIKYNKQGFHACSQLFNCFRYYTHTKDKKYAEVEISGRILTEDNINFCASKIRIIKEIPFDKTFQLCNSGDLNTGNCNSGNMNTGDNNSGNSNTGFSNSGDNNSGGYNLGNNNSGNYNLGDYNSGNCNIHSFNCGNSNLGHNNSSNKNSGNRNTDDCNAGNWNSGINNVGNHNSGNRNYGDYNTGNSNLGDHNSGDYNLCDWSSGLFNTKEQTIFMFNKDTGLRRDEISIPAFLYFSLTKWISKDIATPEQFNSHKKEFETCGGYLEKLDYKEAFQIAWDNASEDDHEQVKQLPNFDADIFYEISGIRV